MQNYPYQGNPYYPPWQSYYPPYYYYDPTSQPTEPEEHRAEPHGKAKKKLINNAKVLEKTKTKLVMKEEFLSSAPEPPRQPNNFNALVKKKYKVILLYFNWPRN